MELRGRLDSRVVWDWPGKRESRATQGHRVNKDLKVYQGQSDQWELWEHQGW